MASTAQLVFMERPQPAARITRVWAVVSHGMTIGDVSWYSQWRRYCYYPAARVVLDASCLDEISSFCRQRTVARKVQRQLASASRPRKVTR